MWDPPPSHPWNTSTLLMASFWCISKLPYFEAMLPHGDWYTLKRKPHLNFHFWHVMPVVFFSKSFEGGSSYQSSTIRGLHAVAWLLTSCVLPLHISQIFLFAISFTFSILFGYLINFYLTFPPLFLNPTYVRRLPAPSSSSSFPFLATSFCRSLRARRMSQDDVSRNPEDKENVSITCCHVLLILSYTSFLTYSLGRCSSAVLSSFAFLG